MSADFAIYLQILWTGLAISSYYILFTVAFVLVLKVVHLWNFAQAGIMGVAFYAMFFAANTLQLGPLPVVLFGLLFTVALTVALEYFGLRTLRDRNSPTLTFFIFTLIFSEFISYLLTLIFGTEPLPLYHDIMSPVRIVGNVAVSNWDLSAVATTLALLAALWLFIRYHRLGKFMIAVANNAELAELYGIDKKRAYLLAMIVAAIFASAGMYLYGSHASVLPHTSTGLMVFAVSATLLGGMTSIFGAAAAALLLGLVQAFSVLFISAQWQSFVVYAFLFGTIILFPTGVKLPRLRGNPLARVR